MAIDSTPQSNLTREQKTGFVLLLVFGLLVVGLGFLQMRNTIYGPFAYHPDKSKSLTQFYSDEKLRLQSIDTDHDGISDYDELYTYHTSPYLPDTDSDGIPDAVEIKNGTDPNCAEGTTCSSGDTMPAGNSLAITSTLNQPTAIDLLGTAVNQSQAAVSAQASSTAPDLSTIANNPAALRSLLLQSGKISADDLKKIDDATLLQLAQQLMQSGQLQ